MRIVCRKPAYEFLVGNSLSKKFLALWLNQSVESGLNVDDLFQLLSYAAAKPPGYTVCDLTHTSHRLLHEAALIVARSRTRQL